MNRIKIIILAILVLVIYSCNKFDKITYGTPTIYGDNVLTL